ncbi:MAG: C10 family peptidase [Bacteroidetes bacterium]|nr:C10 family peptidase [Bacteroidota bacterium]
MKKIILLLCGIAAGIAPLVSAPISQQQAATVALNFYKGTVSPAATTPTVALVRTEADGTVDFYVMSVAPRGFVIVAGDDVIQPVIGYSAESDWTMGYTRTGLVNWMDHAAKHIHEGVLSGLPARPQTAQQWSRLLQGPVGSGSRSAVAPMCTTVWDQEPYYNAQCPFYTPDNQRAVTGCVATAMAQVMRHWSYPAHGWGSFSYVDSISAGFSADYGRQTVNFANATYNWSAMPNSINTANGNIAQLMYHCGVSVAMDYGDDNQGGSGAWVVQQEAGGPTEPCSEYALRHYFGYDTTTMHGLLEADYTAAQWTQLIQSDLDAGRPIIYEGDDLSAGGHAWVCDGYDASGLFHMNWGWSGQDNGYFALNSLTPSGYNFSNDEGALIGIQPPPPFTVLASAASAMVCHGDSTLLTATGPASASYSWTPATGLSCPTCAVTMAAPTTSTNYTVTGDSAGVQVRYSVLISVAPGITADFDAPLAHACSAPAQIQFTNTSQYASTYQWSFGDGATSTDQDPVHSYAAYGTYPVRLVATGSCGVDSVIRTSYITVTDLSPAANGATVCHGTSTTLTATAAGGAQLSWYDDATTTAPIATGASYTTPQMQGTTTWYLEAAIPGATQNAGPATNSFGTGGNFASPNGHSEVFDCRKPQTLVSVEVYAQGAGARTIQLLDSYGDVLDSAVIYVAAGHSTVMLGWNLPVMNNLMLNATGGVNLYRNQSGATYPYYSADSAVVITGSDAGAAYYYFFYNWQLQAPSCRSARVPVTVTVLNGSSSFAAQTGSLSVGFTPVTTTGVTYQWSFGDGATSTDQSPTHTYATSGTYTVQLIESNGSCSDTTTQQVAAFATGITDVKSLSTLSLYPVPAQSMIMIRLSSTATAAAHITITDALGAAVIDHDMTLAAGSSTFDESLSGLAAGVYHVTITSGDSRVTGRFVKE